MRDDRRDARFFDARAEPPDFFLVERLREPAVRVLAEDLERFAAVEFGAVDGVRDSAGNGHVSTDANHKSIIDIGTSGHRVIGSSASDHRIIQRNSNELAVGSRDVEVKKG